MSDLDTAGSDTEEVTEFRCRKCPGKTFTAAEKDAHRMLHKDQKEKEREKRRKPGPRSARTSRRDPSPTPSGVTLFEAIRPEPAPSRPSTSRKRQKPAADGARPGKRRSRKHYDDGVTGNWQNGTGA